MKLFEKIDEKTAIIVFLLIVSVILNVYNIVETYQIKNILTGGETISAPAKQAVKKPSEYKIGKDYYKAIKSEKPMVLLFYADWCHFCINFMPTYEALYKKYKNKYNFVKINVEDPKYAKEVEKYEIVGFPTVFLVNTQKDTHVQLDNAIFGDMNIMQNHLNEFHKKLKK